MMMVLIIIHSEGDAICPKATETLKTTNVNLKVAIEQKSEGIYRVISI